MVRFSDYENVIGHNIKLGFRYTCSKLFFGLRVVFGLVFIFLKKRFLVSLSILDLGNLKLDISFFVDWVRILFFTVLCIIVSCVLKFSCIYMERDEFQVRFTWIVLRFVFSMFCLIFLPHFFFLLIGWDGLGITRFLLVIYYLRDSSWAAGMKTYLINRIGDRFFILGLVLFLYNGYWDIKRVRDKGILAIIVVLGCFTKRAQFPFSRWLPAAMAAPTPVSALVHSSTLVTAGIYVMIRFCHIFPDWLFFLVGVRGLWTLYSASLAACCEFDTKKVVAYSTLSQLGLMGVAISLKLPFIAFFHLITHAMFKALIFICVGYLINKRGHFQDLRRLKGVWLTRPLLAITLLVRRFSLLGFPFLAGFFSKELIIEKDILFINQVFHSLLLFSLPLTAYYRTRLAFNILKGCRYNRVFCNKDKKVLLFSLLPLYLGRILVGSILYPSFYRLRSVFPCHLMKFFVSFYILIGVVLSWLDWKFNKKSLIWFRRSISFLVPFNGGYWTNKLGNFGRQSFYVLDQGILSSIISSVDRKINNSGRWISNSLEYFRSPQAKYYLITIIGLVFFAGLIT